MIVVYIKFVVICYWIDARHFTLDILDPKQYKTMNGKKKEKKIKKKKVADYEFQPLLL